MLFWSLSLFGVTADLWSKYAVFRWLYRDGRGGDYEVVPGAFRLIAQFTTEPAAVGGFRASLQQFNGAVLPRVNQGALFGLGNGFEINANVCFAAISVLAAAAILVWGQKKSVTQDAPLCAALALILGGTLGNLFDRVVFGGVRDFLYFYWFEWPVFNVADCCLVTGAALLLIQAFWPAQTAQARDIESDAELVRAK